MFVETGNELPFRGNTSQAGTFFALLRKMVGVVASVLLLLISSAQADDNPYHDAYCNDAMSALCGPRARAIKDQTWKLRSAAWNKIVASLRGPRGSRSITEYFLTLEKELFQRYQISAADIDLVIRKSKNSILAAIDAEQGLTPRKRSELRRVVERVFVLATVQAPTAGETEERAEFFYSHCKFDGLEANAYFFPVVDGGIVLCPGMVWSMAAQRSNKQEVLLSLIHTLTHELGHSIDATRQPSLYLQFRRCIVENYGSWMSATRPRGEDVFKTVDQRLPEMTADYWATQAMAERFRFENPSFFQRIGILKISMNPLCGQGADEVYPSSLFRVEVLIGRDPKLRRHLSCWKNPPSKLGCTLLGAG